MKLGSRGEFLDFSKTHVFLSCATPNIKYYHVILSDIGPVNNSDVRGRLHPYLPTQKSQVTIETEKQWQNIFLSQIFRLLLELQIFCGILELQGDIWIFSCI